MDETTDAHLPRKRIALRYEDRCALRKLQLDAAAHELIGACTQVGGVHAVYAYGSYARGTVGADSDLDALIIRDTTLRRVQREDDIRRLLRAPVGFDLLIVTPTEFTELMPHNPIGVHILAEAKLLYKSSAD